MSNWLDADLLFINATCYVSYDIPNEFGQEDILDEIALKCHQLKVGTWIIITSYKMPNPKGEEIMFECLLRIEKKMSWGMEDVYLIKKVR